METGRQYNEKFKKQSILLAKEIGNVLLVSSAPGFVSLPCITPSSAALETLRPAQNFLRNTELLQFPRKSNDAVSEKYAPKTLNRLS